MFIYSVLQAELFYNDIFSVVILKNVYLKNIYISVLLFLLPNCDSDTHTLLRVVNLSSNDVS